MISFTEFFEAITFFGEIVIGQIGFQVIAISLGRRGLGEWNPQDSIRFVVMLSTSIIATLICYAPFYAVTISKLELLELINLLIVLSMIFVTLFSFYLISIFKKVINFSDFVSSGAVHIVYSIAFIINIIFILSVLRIIEPNIWLYYLSIHYFQFWSLYVFVRLMIYR